MKKEFVERNSKLIKLSSKDSEFKKLSQEWFNTSLNKIKTIIKELQDET